MQQVKFKKGSMSEARFGNDDNYYLDSLNGDTAVITYYKNGWSPMCVCTVELEAVVPCVTLPVDISDDEIRAMLKNKGYVFDGLQITDDGDITYYRIDEGALIQFIRSLL